MVGCVYWSSSLMAYFWKLCKQKLLFSWKFSPQRGKLKECKFQDFTHFQYLLSLQFDHLKKTYGPLGFYWIASYNPTSVWKLHILVIYKTTTVRYTVHCSVHCNVHRLNKSLVLKPGGHRCWTLLVGVQTMYPR